MRRTRDAPGPSRPKRNPPRRRRPRELPMRQLLLDFTRAPEPTFENFVHGGNGELVCALDAAVQGRPAERVIYAWGESGAAPGATQGLQVLVPSTVQYGATILPTLLLTDGFNPGIKPEIT